MIHFQTYLLLLPLLGCTVSASHVRRRAVGLRFSVATEKIDIISGSDETCYHRDVVEILASCDCTVNLDGVAWKDEQEYIGCLIVHKTFTPCGLQRILLASPCLPFPTTEPTTSSMPTTATPSSYPSVSSLPSSSVVPSSTPSLSSVPSAEPPTSVPSFFPSKNPSASPTHSPSEMSAGYRDGTSEQQLVSDVLLGLSEEYNATVQISAVDLSTMPFLEIAGNNQFPPEAFPLKMCQGDCDSDKDCEGDLQCMMRSGTEPVPRCQGDGETGKDYCTDARPLQPWSRNDPYYKFRMRLFYDPEYFWQETYDETWWCMECARCESYTLGDGHEGNCMSPGPNTTSCMENDSIWIMRCKRGVNDFQYNILKNPGSGDQIRLDSTNLCFSTLNNTYLELKTCSNTDEKQLWMPIQNISKFELRPYWQSHLPFENSLCLTQMHHPKSEEMIGLQPCRRAMVHETMYWEEFHAI